MAQGLSPVPPQAFAPVQIREDRAAYRITDERGFYADDHLWKEGEMIYWDEAPSLGMAPMNGLAREALQKHVDYLDSLGREAAVKAGKAYTSYASAYENAVSLAKQEGRRVELVNGQSDKVVMGAKKRGRPAAEKIESSTAPVQPLGSPNSGKLSLNMKATVNNAVADKGL